jgi:hypothetical protein
VSCFSPNYKTQVTLFRKRQASLSVSVSKFRTSLCPISISQAGKRKQRYKSTHKYYGMSRQSEVTKSRASSLENQKRSQDFVECHHFHWQEMEWPAEVKHHIIPWWWRQWRCPRLWTPPRIVDSNRSKDFMANNIKVSHTIAIFSSSETQHFLEYSLYWLFTSESDKKLAVGKCTTEA